jgi:tetratricopeptide (TPR) repeat protein
VDLLEAALKEFQDAHKGILPAFANPALNTNITFLETLHHYARGERFLLDQLHHPVHQEQTFWLNQRLYRLYQHALQNGGEVSLGSKLALYQALDKKIQADLAGPSQDHRQALINILCGIYRTAHQLKMEGVAANLRTFAFERLPQALKSQTNNYQAIVAEVARTVHDLIGPRDGLEFLVVRTENEPQWFRLNNQDAWSQHGWVMGQWRQEAQNLGAAEERLLKIVVAELRRDLDSLQARQRVIYHRHHGYYWPEKEEVFAKTAEEALARRNRSGAAVKYIAEYLYFGIGRNNRAIDILVAAHNQKILDEGGQGQLVDYLQRDGRFGESIPLLQPLVQSRPENLDYRVRLMRAYFRVGHHDALVALLKDTDAFFHQKDRWQEPVMASLGSSCLENQLYTESVNYFNEAIPLHQRTALRRGIGDGVLAGYYTELARAYCGLHKTPEAVDAACGAVVCWSRHEANRRQTLETLQKVLREAPELDGYLAYLAAKTVETGMDNAIVRKALGQAYFAKAQYPLAIAMLQLAAVLQPNDRETHQLLIDCYDRQGDKEGAVRQLLQSVQLSRRDIKLYQELGHRYDGLNQPHEGERAYTSIVEVLSNESESHSLLAETREKQDRWAEAIAHWQHVAKIRALEPGGLLRLANAQLHEKQYDQAVETLRQLKAKTWPQRFGDVGNQIRELEQRLDKARNQ